jgi:hypothetical protein
MKDASCMKPEAGKVLLEFSSWNLIFLRENCLLKKMRTLSARKSRRRDSSLYIFRLSRFRTRFLFLKKTPEDKMSLSSRELLCVFHKSVLCYQKSQFNLLSGRDEIARHSRINPSSFLFAFGRRSNKLKCKRFYFEKKQWKMSTFSPRMRMTSA